VFIEGAGSAMVTGARGWETRTLATLIGRSGRMIES
jgi:hypothetical protein